ncbi:MAG: hypothetical protein ACI9EF_002185 [Pseudohongiellaceae bacterium]|jgi:hypothetical protein
MASAPRWCQIETANRIRISGFVEDSATKSWRHRGLLGARHFTHRLLLVPPAVVEAKHDLASPGVIALFLGEVAGRVVADDFVPEGNGAAVRWVGDNFPEALVQLEAADGRLLCDAFTALGVHDEKLVHDEVSVDGVRQARPMCDE